MLASAWMFLSLLNDHVSIWLINSDPQGTAFLTILLILAALMVTNSLHRGFRFASHLRHFILFMGWFLIGIFFVQVVVPESIIILSQQGESSPSIHPIVLILLIGWAFIILVYLFTFDLRTVKGLDRYFPTYVLQVPRFIGFGGMVLFVIQPLVIRLDPDLGRNYLLLVADRLLVQFAILFFMVILLDDPTVALEIGRRLRKLYDAGEIGLAFFGFDETGPTLWFSKGDFAADPDGISRLLSIGLSAMVALGQDDEYVVGSVLIPIAGNRHTALGLGNWMKDASQADPRMKGRTFVVGVVILPNTIAWIFDHREHLEASFTRFLQHYEDRSQLSPEAFYEFMRSELLEIGISS